MIPEAGKRSHRNKQYNANIMNFRNTELRSHQPVAKIDSKDKDVGDGLVASCDENSDLKRKGTQLQADRETSNFTMQHEQVDNTKKTDTRVRQSFFFVQSYKT